MIPIAAFFANNQFASGGIIMVLLGGLLASLRGIPAKLWKFVRHRLLFFEVVIRSDDELYAPIESWIASCAKQSKNYKLITRHKGNNPYSDYKEGESVVIFSLGDGEHIFNYENQKVWTTVGYDESANKGSTKPLWTITLRMRNGSKDKIFKIVREAKIAYEKQFDNLTHVYYWNTDYWTSSNRKKMRSLNSIVLEDNLGETIKNDIVEFIGKKEWYRSLGIPHRRSYLLYGTPGNGKSSLIAAIASELGMNVAILTVSRSMDDNSLRSAIRDIPANSVLCIEDVDVLFKNREHKHDKVEVNGGSSVTFSGLLNTLDGIDSKEQQVIFMTTNHREVLDPALIRPGRVDMHIPINNASKQQAKEMFLRFFPHNKTEADAFAARTENNKYNMATIQEHLLRHKTDAVEASREEIIMEVRVPKRKKGNGRK